MTKRKPANRKPLIDQDQLTCTANAPVSTFLSVEDEFRAAWHCPGCDLYYAPFVKSCDCLVRELEDVTEY